MRASQVNVETRSKYRTQRYSYKRRVIATGSSCWRRSGCEGDAAGKTRCYGCLAVTRLSKCCRDHSEQFLKFA